jgi:hypothetical protein
MNPTLRADPVLGTGWAMPRRTFYLPAAPAIIMPTALALANPAAPSLAESQEVSDTSLD